MLGGGPASQYPRTQSQQICGALPRTVTPVSSRYPQLLCVLACVAGVLAIVNPDWRRATARSGRRRAHALVRPVRRRSRSLNQNQSADCARRGESPLSDAVASCPPDNGDRHGRAVRQQEGQGDACPGLAMLSVPTLWTVFVINFLAVGLIWAYVMRSYPAFEAARFWTGSAFAGAGGAALAMLRFVVDSLVPLLIGGTVLIFAACLAAMGIKRFYGQPVSWRGSARDHRIEFRRHGVLHRRLRQPADADPDLFAGPVAAAGADAEAVAVAAGRPRKPWRPARGHRRHFHYQPLCRPHRGDPAASSAAISRSSSPIRCSGCWC